MSNFCAGGGKQFREGGGLFYLEGISPGKKKSCKNDTGHNHDTGFSFWH
jgi:hypothetical protein